MNEFNEVLITAGLSILTAAVGYIMLIVERYLKTRFNLEIEERHRKALHSALETGARAAVSKVASRRGIRIDQLDGSEIEFRDDLRDLVAEYVKISVPDAIKKLKPDPEIEFALMDSAIQKVLQK